MCEYKNLIYFNPTPSLKYDSKNDVFYLYINGGNAAGYFFGKYVFDEKEIIARHLVDYGDLSSTASFRINFKGF